MQSVHAMKRESMVDPEPLRKSWEGDDGSFLIDSRASNSIKEI